MQTSIVYFLRNQTWFDKFHPFIELLTRIANKKDFIELQFMYLSKQKVKYKPIIHTHGVNTLIFWTD